MVMIKKTGIVGCGVIGTFVAKSVCRDLKHLTKISALCDIDTVSAEKLSRAVFGHPKVTSLDELIERSDIVVESASSEASFNIAKKALEKGRDVMIMSVGGIAAHIDQLFNLSRKAHAKIIMPSGAICGLDGIKSAKTGNINKVSLTTRKPPKGLMGAPFIKENKIDLESITEEKTIFIGSAQEAIKAFPKNINVSALLSIIGIGSEKTQVKIITSPEYMVNTHEVEVEGDFGRLIAITENVACADNPKTSFLACLSAVASLKQALEDVLRIGT
jgi:aspartate dehydrogenase